MTPGVQMINGTTPLYSVNLDSNLIDMGAIFGSSSPTALLDQLNRQSGASVIFGSQTDPFQQGFASFNQQIIRPLNESSGIDSALASITNKIMNNDVMIPINTAEQLKSIPPSMHMPIVYFPPIRALLEDGKIDGFGIDPKDLNPEDSYANVVESGYVEFTSEDIDKDGHLPIVFKSSTLDPELSDEEIEAIRITRRFLEEFLNDPDTSFIDPTQYPSLRA